MTYLIDVLRGVENERILQAGHHQISTFGIGNDLSAADWKSVFRQLVANGFLRADPEGYGALQLTEECRPLLRGEETTLLRKDPVSRKTSGRGDSTSRRQAFRDQITDQPGWDALRACRKELADQQSVPPYVIFHDATLFEILERRPRTLDELAEINGVGRAKLEKYGDSFLAALAGLEAR